MARINSQDYKKNDMTMGTRFSTESVKRAVVSPFEGLSARNFDLSPTVFSSEIQKNISSTVDSIMQIYSQGEEGKSITPEYRYAVDTVMSLALNKPYQDVAKNHNLYMRMFTGEDIEDKSFIEAFADAWKREGVQGKLADLMTRYDYSNDENERLELVKELKDTEQELFKLSDYSDRSWLGSNVVQSAPIFRQVLRMTALSVAGGLAGGAVGMLASGLGLGSKATQVLTLANVLGKSSSAAVTAGRIAGLTYDAIANVYAREAGSFSYELFTETDANGNRVDDDTRRKASMLYGAISTAIEYFTPEPAFGKLILGMPDNVIKKPIKKYLTETLKGAFSESIEEGLQGAVSEVAKSISQYISNKNNNTVFNVGTVEDIIMTALEEGASSFGDAFVPSLIVGGVGNAVQAPVYRRRYNAYLIEEANKDAINKAKEAQEHDSTTNFIKTDYVNFKYDSVDGSYHNLMTKETQEDGTVTETDIAPPVKVFLAEDGKYTPIDEENADLAKHLYDSGLKALAIDIVNNDFGIDQSDLSAVANTFGATEVNGELVFSSQDNMDSFIKSFSQDFDTNSNIMTLRDTEGNNYSVNLKVETSTQNPTSVGLYKENQTQDNTNSELEKFRKYLEGVYDSSDNAPRRVKVNRRKQILRGGAEALLLYSRATGLTADEVIGKKIVINIDLSTEATRGNGIERGSITTQYTQKGESVFTITLTRNANVRTLTHEVGHAIRASLSNEELSAFSSEYGFDLNGTWISDIVEENGKYRLGQDIYDTREEAVEVARLAEEEFAKGFEEYVALGESPIPELASVFKKMKDFMEGILKANYSQLNENLKVAYDNLFKNSNERISQNTEADVLHQNDPSRKKSGESMSSADIKRLSNKDFLRRADEGQVIDVEVLQEKVDSKNTEVSKVAKKLLSTAEKVQAIDTATLRKQAKNAESFATFMNDIHNPVFSTEVYYAFYKKVNLPTMKEQANALQRKLNSKSALVAFKKKIGTEVILTNKKTGQSIKRIVVGTPDATVNYSLDKISPAMSDADVQTVLNSMTRHPKEWLDAYYTKTGEALIPGYSADEMLYQNHIEYETKRYEKSELEDISEEGNMVNATGEEIQNAESEHEFNEANVKTGEEEIKAIQDKMQEQQERIAELDDTMKKLSATDSVFAEVESLLASISQSYANVDTDLVEEQKFTESERRRSQKRISDLKADIATLREKLKDAKLSGEIAGVAYNRLANRFETTVSELENRIQSLNAKLNEQRDKSAAEISGYAQTIKELKAEVRSQKRIASEAQKTLEALKKSKNRKIEELRSARDLWMKAFNIAERQRKNLETAYNGYRYKRRLQRALKFNTATTDARFQEVANYAFFYLNDGQKRRFSNDYTDTDYDIQALASGLATEENGIEVNFYKTDGQGNVVEDINEYTGKLAMYKYSQNNIPQMLKENMSTSLLTKVESGTKYSELSLQERKGFAIAVENAKKEASSILGKKKADYWEKQTKIENEMAKTATHGELFSTAIPKSVEESILATYHKNSMEEVTEDELNTFRRKNPLLFIEKKEQGFKGIIFNKVFTHFGKMQTLANILDGSKKGGAFTTMFYDRVLAGMQNYYREYKRRSDRATSEINTILGETKAERDSKRTEFFNKSFEYTLKNGYTRKFTGNNLMAMYIYSKNITGLTKLISPNGNNILLEDIAKINPVSTLEFVNMELADRAFIENDKAERAKKGLKEKEYPKTSLFRVDTKTLEKIKSQLEASSQKSILPEYATALGDKLISLLKEETPRYAQAVYDNFNEIIELVDNYFPLTNSTRLVGNSITETKQKNVNSGNKESRKLDADYELLLEPLEVFYSALKAQERLINLGQQVKDMNRALSSHGGNLQKILSDTYGGGIANYVQEYVNTVAGKRESVADLYSLMNKAVGNIATAKLAFNMMTSIKQVFSVIPALTDGYINGADFSSGLWNYINNHKAMSELVDNLAPEIEATSSNIEIERLLMNSNYSNMDKAMTQFREFMMKPVEGTDKFIKKVVWLSAYQKGLKNNMSEAESALNASKLIQRTQSTSMEISTAPAQRTKNPFMRVFFLFTNDLFQMWNALYGYAPLEFKNKNYLGAFEKFAGALMTGAALAFASGSWLPDEDDEKDTTFDLEDFVKSFIQNTVSEVVPIFGGAIQEQISGWSSSSIFEGMKTAQELGTMVYKSATGDKEYAPEEWMKQIFDTSTDWVEPFVPFPSVQAERTVGAFFTNGVSGGVNFNPVYLLLGRTWGEGVHNLLE